MPGEGRALRLTVAALAALGLALAPGPASGEGTFLADRRGDRLYRLFVPSAAQTPGAALPLLVALHGCWQTPEDFATGTRLNQAAERRGLLVLYPMQGPRDNRSRCWNWFQPARRDAGEAGELLALVREVAQRHPVARDRVFVVGFSAGGFMAVNLACLAPDVVAGIAVAAGGPYGCGRGPVGALQCMRGQSADGEAAAAACAAARGPSAPPPRAALWHGTEDVVVSPVNFEALTVMFARLGGAVSSAVEKRDGALYSVFRDAAGRTVLETWLVPDMGHAWSGGDPRGTHTFPRGPDATERILTFLLGGG